MKLRTIVLGARLKELKKQLDELVKKDDNFTSRANELKTAFVEITAETPAEDRAAVEKEIEDFDAEQETHEAEKKRISEEIAATEDELKQLEDKQENTQPEETPAEDRNERKVVSVMNTRTMAIFGTRTRAEVESMIKREEVKAWITEYRNAIKEKRAIQNVGLTIPEVMLPIIRENIERYSKLYDRVYLKRVRGEAKQNLTGTIPEAVWTECCATLNELSWGFYQETFGCYMVGGFYVLCNANIEDSDMDLAAEILGSFGRSIGLALDKAILWGRNIAANNSMPQGIVPSLAQTSQPADWSAVALPWVDLHTSNIVSVGSVASPLSGAALIAGIIEASGCTDTKYSRGEMTWAMNNKTYKKLVSSVILATANGEFRSAVNGEMPVLGGDIVVLDFLPDNVIPFGYFDLYELVERKGQTVASSEHVRFLQNETVYKGIARYDGKPVVRKAFGVILLNGAELDLTDVTFPQDAANLGN